MRFIKAKLDYLSFCLAIFKLKTLSFRHTWVNLSPGVENYYSIEANTKIQKYKISVLRGIGNIKNTKSVQWGSEYQPYEYQTKFG